MIYYDRDGTPLSMMEWASQNDDKDKKVVGRDLLDDGRRVSTVWIGIDHSFGSGPPLIFETMVFPEGKRGELFCDRYATLEQAVAGHAAVVKHLAAGGAIEDIP